VSDSSPQQSTPWQQTDLLALMAPQPSAAAPRAAPSSSPATLLILDTETTGLDPAQGQCVEVGAILFAVPQRAVLSQVSFLLPVNANPAEAINGIPAAVSRLPQPWQAGLHCFNAMLEASDAVLAHNATFDRQWFGIDPLPPVTRPWICSMEDIRWPAALRLKSTPGVKDLALAHGIPVWAAHRALTDCIYLAQVLERCQDLEALLAAALEPRHTYRALVSYAERHKAREAGFRWNEPVAGAWSRRLSDDEARALPFAVQRVHPDGHSATSASPASRSEPGPAVAA
jgi:DNA polymerase-3 subunit epsilon